MANFQSSAELEFGPILNLRLFSNTSAILGNFFLISTFCSFSEQNRNIERINNKDTNFIKENNLSKNIMIYTLYFYMRCQASY